MKKIYYIIAVYFCSCSVFNKVPDDVKHHYAGASVAVGTGMVSYKIIKRPLASGLIGFGFGCAVTELKENWFDGKLNKGVKSINDKRSGRWGATCGGFYVFSGYMIKQSNEKIDTTYFQNLR